MTVFIYASLGGKKAFLVLELTPSFPNTSPWGLQDEEEDGLGCRALPAGVPSAVWWKEALPGPQHSKAQ